MERPGRELLPCSRFTRDEDRGLGFGKTAELVSYLNGSASPINLSSTCVRRRRSITSSVPMAWLSSAMVFSARTPAARVTDLHYPEEPIFSPNPVRAATYFPAAALGVSSAGRSSR